MEHDLKTIKKHILGPYWIKSIDGEVYYINNILELYNVLPKIIISKRFNFNGANNYNEGFEFQYGRKPNVLNTLKVDIENCSSEMISLLSVLNAHILESTFFVEKNISTDITYYKVHNNSIFTITHAIYPDLLEGMSKFRIETLIRLVAKNLPSQLNAFYYYDSFLFTRLGFKQGNFHYFRRPKTLNEIRKNKADIKEYGECLVRGKRRNIPDAWEDLPKDHPRLGKSWKQKKIRKQWMKNI